MSRSSLLGIGSLTAMSLALLALASWAVLDDAPIHLERAEQASGVRQSARPDIPGTWAWTPGAEWSYSFRHVSTVASEVENGGGMPALVSELTGSLKVRVSEVTAGSVTLDSVLTSPRLEIAGQRDEAAEAQLDHGFQVRISPSGRVERMIWPGERIDADTRVRVESLVRILQIVLPDDAALDTWTTEETDTSGDFEARYERRPDGSLVKRKLAYRRVVGDLGQLGGIEVDDSELLAWGDPRGGWIGSLHFSERIHTPVRNGVSFLAEQRLELERRAPGRSHVEVVGELPPFTDPRRVPLEVGRMPRDEVQRLVDLIGSGGGGPISLRQLASLLTLDPALDQLVLERLARGDVEGGDISRLFHALEIAGTPEAQRILIGVVDAEDSPFEQRVYAVVALGGVERPTAEAAGLALSIARREGIPGEVRNGGILSAGRMARRLTANENELGLVLLEDLSAMVREEATPGRVATALLALGNAKSASVADLVIRSMSHGDAIVRRAAATALAQTPCPDGASILAAHLSFEQDDHARSRIAEGLGKRPDLGESELSVMQTQLLQDDSNLVRLALARALASRVADEPLVLSTLHRQFLVETDQEVRLVLGAALAAAQH